jgi:predicted AlkP superfamily pyrophosphatase or phosphodiesterase
VDIIRYTRLFTVIAFLAAVALQPGFGADGKTALLLISIDGMRPDYVLKADQYRLKIPHLRRLLSEGAHASGVRGVVPTVTYPSHTTILTGVWPAKHGIYSNVAFDPFNLNAAGWNWYAEDIAVPTSWDAAAKAGLQVGSVSWPVSVGARSVTYLIPEYWRAPKFPDDIKLLRALSTPGLMAEIEKQAGRYVNDLDDAEGGDRQRTSYAAAILRTKRPQFMTVHLAALDHLQHAAGPFSPEALATIEQSDAEIGEMEDAAKAVFSSVILCVVSDHGFARTDHDFNLMAPIARAGLAAFVDVDGGSASVILLDRRDEATRAKVGQLLQRLATDPANGIDRVLGAKEIAAMGGWPEAAFRVDMKIGFAVVVTGPQVQARKVGGTHGYLPTHPELLASFFIAGPGVRKGLDLGEIDMRSVAPTVAKALGTSLPLADLKGLEIFIRTR